jgi:DNA-binding response OmpR family regulator
MSDSIQALQDRIEELEGLLGMNLPRLRIGKLSKLRKTPYKVLGLLLKRELVTRDYIHTALYGGKPESEQPGDLRVVDQHVCHINRALKEHGLKVHTEYGIGYYLDKSARETLREWMGEGKCGDGGRFSSTTGLHS